VKHILHPVKDETVSRLILKHYSGELIQALDSPAIVVGAGPAGLYCALRLAQAGTEVTIFDHKLSPGGGIWGGSMGCNKVVFQKDVQGILDELGVSYLEDEGALVTSSLHFASTLIARASAHPSIRFFNLLTVVDLCWRDERIAGVVVNPSAIELQRLHVDPMVFTAKAVLDATGHDAVLVNLYQRRRNLSLVREFFMNAALGEENVIENTQMVAPGLFVAGMAANNVSGGYRMGPIFGGMLLSGQKAASLMLEYLRIFEEENHAGESVS